jgi:hypothetical protein
MVLVYQADVSPDGINIVRALPHSFLQKL